MPLSSPAGMSGAVYRAWCTRGGHAPARRLWCAQKTPRICLLRSGMQRTRGLPASPRLHQAAVLNPRIKSLSGARSLGFMGVRAAGQAECAHIGELGCTGANCNPDCSPAVCDHALLTTTGSSWVARLRAGIGELGECESLRLDACSLPQDGRGLARRYHCRDMALGSLAFDTASHILLDHAPFTLALLSKPRRAQWLRGSQLS
jgi:hypothetical protein